MHRIGGGDEHDFGQIHRHFDKIVAEAVVLLGIQDFQQSGSWVAAEIGGQFVDLIEEEDRIGRLGIHQAAHDAARHSAHVRPAMTADLCFIPHAA